MSQEDGESAPLYRLDITDVAEEEASRTYLWLSQNVSLEYAKRWYNGLLLEISKLPSTARHWPIARENDQYDAEVRRPLYRVGRTAYRVLYRVVEPDTAGDVGAIRVLHIYPSAWNTDDKSA